VSGWADKLRGPVGDGCYETIDAHVVAIGLPHPLWQQMCDVVEAASRANSHLYYGRRVPYSTRLDLSNALDRLKQEITA
jgi:hypothetical protein